VDDKPDGQMLAVGQRVAVTLRESTAHQLVDQSLDDFSSL
jgi:hypothetical protein